MKEVPEKELRRLLEEYGKEKGLPPLPEGTRYLGFVDQRGEEPEVYVSERAKSKFRIHEMWHLENPLPSPCSPTVLVDNEIGAELHAWRTVDKSPTIMVGIPAASNLMDTWPSRYNARRATSLVIGRLRHFGVPEPTWDERETFEALLGGS